MRNLKRMLCLALTVVMLVGMMVVGAGAAGIDGFGDKAEIEHKDAVALLVELGIINGNNDGNFYPNDRLTREQMAKIAYLVMQVNQDFSMYENTPTTLTDISGRWSTGAIAWCTSAGIIAGGNDGTFSPEGTLTVAQAQTFLLRTLGYDNKVSGLTGTGWDINAGILAQERGLMKGLTGLKSGDFITRDQVCQMAFNAIFTKGVVPDKQFNFLTGEQVIVGYKTDEYGNYTGKTKAESVFGLQQITGTVGAVETDKDGNLSMTVTYKYMDGNTEKTGTKTIPADASLVGANVTIYTRGEAATVVSAATSNNSTVVASNLTKSAYDAGLKAKTYTKADGAKFYINGVEGKEGDMNNGSVIELVNTNNDNKIEVVRVINKTVTTLKADPATGEDGKITSDELGLNKADPKTVVGIENVKKGDVALFVKIAGVTYVEKADITTGKVSSVTSGATGKTYNVGGEKLALSKLTGAAESIAPNFDDEYNFYLDNAGNIVAMAKAGEAPVAPEVKYAVTMDFGYKGTTSGEIDATTNTTYQVKLLKTDGEQVVVDLVSYKVSGGTTYTVDGSDTLQSVIVTAQTLKDSNTGKLVSYTVEDGKYTVEEVGTNFATGNLDGGKANFTANLVGNKNTTFLMKIGTGDDTEYRVVNGVANLPTSTNATGKGGGIQAGQYFAEDSFVTVAYVVLNGIDGESTKQVAYLVDGTKYTQTAEGYEIAAIVDGEAVTLTVAKDKWNDPAIAAKTGLVFYTTTDGKVTATTAIDKDTTGLSSNAKYLQDITSVTGGVIEFANGGTKAIHQLADDAVIYKMTSGAFAKAEKIDADKIPTRKDAVTSYDAYVEFENADSDVIVMIYVLPGKADSSINSKDQDEVTQAEIDFANGDLSGKTETTVTTPVDYTMVLPGEARIDVGGENFDMDWKPKDLGDGKDYSWITTPGAYAYPKTGSYAFYNVKVPEIKANEYYRITKHGWGGMDQNGTDKLASADISDAFDIIVDNNTTKITIEVGGTKTGDTVTYKTTYTVNLPGWTK